MSLTQINKAGLDELALDHVFTIGAYGTDHYTFQGEGLNGTVNDPTLYLTRGKTYRFENGTGAHPIRIQSTSGASGTAYNTGVTNNAGSGTVIVEVQHDAPDVLYYQCTSHAAMNGILYITGALADGGVTTAKLADDAVTDAKLANSINTAIAANTAKTTNATHTGDVTGSGSLTIASGAVTTAKIADDAVTAAKLASNAVVNASVDASAAIAGTKISPDFGSQNITTTGHVDLPDAAEIKLGDSDELSISHAANGHSYILENGSGDLNIHATQIKLKDISGNNKIETTSAGATVTGTLSLPDGDSGTTSEGGIKLGASGDLHIYHDGNNSHIKETGTGDLIITGKNNITFLDYGTNETMAKMTSDGAVELYYDNGKVFETGSSEVKTHRRVQIHADGPGSGHGMSIGQWDGGNHRIEGDANRPILITSYNSGGVRMGVNGSNRFAVLANGVAFNGDTATANQLDDYEEGTWTPSYRYGANVTTTGNSNGEYIRIGNLVYFRGLLQNSYVAGGQSWQADIAGLPFTPNSGGYGIYAVNAYGTNWSYGSGMYGIIANVNEGHASVFLRANNAQGHNSTPTAYNMTNTTSTYIAGCYHTLGF